MSAKKKNQHFVPRHYLKRFSFDGGSRIGLFNLVRKLCVSGAPVKSQCSSNYFYGKDPTAENMLKALEDVAETTFKKICDHKDIPRSRGEREELLITLALMHHRTERAAGPLNEMMEITLKNVIRKRRGAQGKEVPDCLDRVRIRDRAMPVRMVKVFLQRYQLVLDLELRLVLPPTGKTFITSDHPVVLLNQAFFDIVNSPAINGLANKGIQFFLPLSPELLLVAFDREFYRVGSPNRTVVSLDRSEDCDLINALQIINAEENVYFQSERDSQLVRSLLTKFDRARSKARESERAITAPLAVGKPGSLVISGGLRVPVPGKWSFCKLRRPVDLQAFGPRRPDLCALMEEHAREMKRTGRIIMFDDWMDERRAKSRLRNPITES